MCERVVDKNSPKYAENQESGEFDSFGEGSNDKRWCNYGKHSLEKNENQCWNSRTFNVIDANAFQHKVIESSHERFQKSFGAAKGHAISNNYPLETHNSH